jgi:hypothetical protein
VGLVGVAEIRGQRGPVHRLAAVGALGGLVQPGPAHHPLGADSHVVGEQPLQGARGYPGGSGQLVDPAQPGIVGDARDQRGGLLGQRIPLRQHRVQQRLRMPDHDAVIHVEITDDRLPGLLRPRPEQPRGRHHPVGQLGDRRLPERPEAAGREPYPEGQA